MKELENLGVVSPLYLLEKHLHFLILQGGAEGAE